MAKDYSGAQALAQRLITKFGRTITILKSDNTTEVSAGKPWNGYTEADTELADVPAVFVADFGQLLVDISDNEFASLVARDENALMVAKLDVPSDDLTEKNKVIDGSVTYQIERVLQFQPGPVVLFYVLILKG